MKLDSFNNRILKIGIAINADEPTHHATAFWCDVNGQHKLLTAAHVISGLQEIRQMVTTVKVWVADINSVYSEIFDCDIEVHSSNDTYKYKMLNDDPIVDIAWIKPKSQSFPKPYVFSIATQEPNVGDSMIGLGFPDQIQNISYMHGKRVRGKTEDPNCRSNRYVLKGGALPACSGCPFFIYDKVSSDWTEPAAVKNDDVSAMLCGGINVDYFVLQSATDFDW